MDFPAGDQLAAPAPCRWLAVETRSRISDTYVLGSVFLPEPEQTGLGREDSGAAERRRARRPKFPSTTSSVPEEQPKR